MLHAVLNLPQGSRLHVLEEHLHVRGVAGAALAAKIFLVATERLEPHAVDLRLGARVLQSHLHLARLDELVLEAFWLRAVAVLEPAQRLTILEVEPLWSPLHQLVGVSTVLDQIYEAVGVLTQLDGAADLPHALVVEVPHAVLRPVQDLTTALEPW